MNEENNEYHLLDESDNNKNIYEKRSTLNFTNQDNAEFIGFIVPKEIDSQCFCGCNLTKGMYVTCVFLFFQFSLNFFRIFKETSYRGRIIAIILTIAYPISIFNIYKATIKLDDDSAIFAYKFFMIVFYIDVGFFIFESLYVLITDPKFFFSFTILGLFLVYGLEFINFFFELYMLWVVFCFMIHVCSSRLYLLQNNFGGLLKVDQ